MQAVGELRSQGKASLVPEVQVVLLVAGVEDTVSPAS